MGEKTTIYLPLKSKVVSLLHVLAVMSSEDTLEAIRYKVTFSWDGMSVNKLLKIIKDSHGILSGWVIPNCIRNCSALASGHAIPDIVQQRHLLKNIRLHTLSLPPNQRKSRNIM